MSDDPGPAAIVDRFLSAFNTGDTAAMRGTLADDAVAYVTGPDGSSAVDYSVALTQPPVSVGDGRTLIMVEVHARRGDRTLVNYAAHLLKIADGKITQLHMVDAKPAESDAFWA